MSIDEVQYWNDYFKDKIKDKNQPILHIFKNIENDFPKSIQTFYKYVHKGYFPSINDEMLARSFNYKPRNKKETVKTITKDNFVSVIDTQIAKMNFSNEEKPVVKLFLFSQAQFLNLRRYELSEQFEKFYPM